MKISARAFQLVFTRKIWLRYSRERASWEGSGVSGLRTGKRSVSSSRGLKVRRAERPLLEALDPARPLAAWGGRALGRRPRGEFLSNVEVLREGNKICGKKIPTRKRYGSWKRNQKTRKPTSAKQQTGPQMHTSICNEEVRK